MTTGLSYRVGDTATRDSSVAKGESPLTATPKRAPLFGLVRGTAEQRPGALEPQAHDTVAARSVADAERVPRTYTME